MKRALAFAPLALFALVAVALATGLTNDPRVLPSTMIDRPMPDFTLEPLYADAPAFAPGDLGDDIALVNVFGSWCVSCVIEHPTLMRLSREGAARIYGVDWRDTPEDGRAWLARYGDPFEKVGVDAQSRLAIDLGVTGAPETYVVDREGRIRYKHIGPITDDVWRDVFTPLLSDLRGEAG